MNTEELRDRVARARRARPSCSDPYVVGLADLADLVTAYFAARYRYKSCDSVEVGIASARDQLADAVTVVTTAKIERALADLGTDRRPDPDWQASVWRRIERPNWWRRTWNRIIGRKS